MKQLAHLHHSHFNRTNNQARFHQIIPFFISFYHFNPYQNHRFIHQNFLLNHSKCMCFHQYAFDID
jgi:hypothetical protein